ncbi:MAG: hypothetical protein M3217_09210, partial [Actinomycetota bacterium]|nr:hypothetical protein [Actinomycetota bacterium]
RSGRAAKRCVRKRVARRARKVRDTTPPDTTITAGPSGTIETTSASFGFSSNETRVTFHCRLDAGSWGSCTSPKVLASLAYASHTFEVRAKDAAGNLDPTPAARSFAVQAPPPPEPTPTPEPTSEPQATGSGPQLSWGPPALTSPTTITVDDSTPMPLYLDPTKDYVVKLGHRTKTHGVVISGGRNIVMVGGRISIPYAGTNPTIEARRGLYLERNTGTVHIEGLLIDGPDLSEGIQIAAPNAVVQLQNVRVIGVHARDQVNFSDYHPDCLQPWGGVRKIQIDRMTCTTDTHGLYFDSNDARRLGGPIGAADIRRYNIKRTLKSDKWAFQRVTQDGDQPMTLSDVYVEPAAGTSLYNSVGNEPWRNGVYNFLPATISGDGTTASWPQDASLSGAVKKGPPPAGDFAPDGMSGTAYASPGYVQ